MSKKVKRYASGGQERRNPTVKDVALGGFDQAAATLRGLVRGGLGLPGDLESLARMLAGADPEKGFFPTTEDMDKYLPRYSRTSTYQSDINPYDISAAQDDVSTLFAPGTALKPINAAHKAAGKGFAKATKPLVGPLSKVAAKTHGAVTNAAPVAARDSEYTANMALASRSGNAEDWKKLMKAPKGVNESSAEYLARRAASDPNGGLAQIAQMVTPRGVNVIKDKGGNWHPGTLNDYLSKLTTSGDPSLYAAGPPKPDQIARHAAADKWVQSNLRKYMMTDMGTIDDPLRALSEQGIFTRSDFEAQLGNHGLNETPMPWNEASSWRNDPYSRGYNWADKKHMTEVGARKGIDPKETSDPDWTKADAAKQALKRTPWDRMADNAILQGAATEYHPRRIRYPGAGLLPSQLAADLQGQLERRLGTRRTYDYNPNAASVYNYDTGKYEELFGGAKVFDTDSYYPDRSGDGIPPARKMRNMSEEEYNKWLQSNMWVTKAPEDKAIYRLDPELTEANTDYLGFQDVVRNLARSEINPNSISKVSVPDAVKAWHDLRERSAADLRGKLSGVGAQPIKRYEGDQGLHWTKLTEPIENDIPEGLVQRWDGKDGIPGTWATIDPSTGKPFRSTSPYARDLYAVGETPGHAGLAGNMLFEGNQMGHCIGQYCYRVRNGEWDVVSLRDAKGEPHITAAITKNGQPITNVSRYGMAKKFLPDDIKKEVEEIFKDRGYTGNVDDWTDWSWYLPQPTQDSLRRIKTGPTLNQIKGNSNLPVAGPYVEAAQDFIKSNNFYDPSDLNYAHMFNPTEQGMNDAVEFYSGFLDPAYKLDMPDVYKMKRDEIDFINGRTTDSPYRQAYHPGRDRWRDYEQFRQVHNKPNEEYHTFRDIADFYQWLKAGKPTPAAPPLETQGAIPTLNQTDLPGMAAGGLVGDGLRREIAQNLQELMNG